MERENYQGLVEYTVSLVFTKHAYHAQKIVNEEEALGRATYTTHVSNYQHW